MLYLRKFNEDVSRITHEDIDDITDIFQEYADKHSLYKYDYKTPDTNRITKDTTQRTLPITIIA